MKNEGWAAEKAKRQVNIPPPSRWLEETQTKMASVVLFQCDARLAPLFLSLVFFRLIWPLMRLDNSETKLLRKGRQRTILPFSSPSTDNVNIDQLMFF